MEATSKFAFDVLSALAGGAFGLVVGIIVVLAYLARKRGIIMLNTLKLVSAVLGAVGYLAVTVLFAGSFGGKELPWIKAILAFLGPFSIGLAVSSTAIVGLAVFVSSNRASLPKDKAELWFDLPRTGKL